MVFIIAEEKKASSENYCQMCGDCCRFIVTPVPPAAIKDPAVLADYMYWATLHGGVLVKYGKDLKGRGFKFNIPCEKLTKEGLCSVHGERPEMCRRMPEEFCTKKIKGNYDPVVK